MASPRTSFEWDARKDKENLAKHGVSFALAQSAFFDPKRVIARDLKHGAGEERYYCIGKASGGILTVRFTWRGGRIRIIGAGYWRKGKVAYEKAGNAD
ncbi:MAG: BrnT family toxin [Nitrospinae bacterium]|nr:BrnT family toxin [Nitrospinota bacterium]